MKFYDSTLDFHARFVANTTITEPTILYLNEDYWYTNGYTIQLSSPTGRILIQGTDFSLDLSQHNYAKILITNTRFNNQAINIVVAGVQEEEE
jgi:hypothetical protein